MANLGVNKGFYPSFCLIFPHVDDMKMLISGQVCDGADDCGDMSDELAGCSRKFISPTWKLKFTVCVLLSS